MGGYMQFRAGAWRLEVDAGSDPFTGKRRKVRATVHAPDNKPGKAKANGELAKLITDTDRRLALPSSGVTVGELLERWVEYRRPAWEERSPGQADATLSRIRKHMVPLVGADDLDRFQPLDITRLYDTWRRGAGQRKPLAEGTVRRLHDILHSALEWAVRMDLIARNPADRVDTPKKPKAKPKAPEPALIADMIAACVDGLPAVKADGTPATYRGGRNGPGRNYTTRDPALALFLRTGALTGGRRGQLCALRWDRLVLPDDGDGSILWNNALAVVKGGTAEKGTKTGLEWRVSIDPRTVELFRGHLRVCRERALSVGVALAPDAFVFAQDVAGTAPWHPDGASQRFAALRRRYAAAHPDVDVSDVQAKDLRNYMVTELLGDNEDPTVVATRGGWSNNTTPLNIYAAFRPARDQAAARRLADGLDG